MDKEALLELLIFSLDNELPAQQKLQLEKALQEQPWLRKEKQVLLQLRAGLARVSAPPSESFTDAVMADLGKSEELRHSIIVRLFPKVAAACAVFLLAFILNVYFSDGSISMDSVIGVADLSPEEAYSLLLEE